MTPDLLRLYVGTYSLSMSFVKGRGVGIYTCQFDPQSGKLEVISETAAPNPSYLAVHPSGKYLYAVNEISEDAQSAQDAVSAFALDPESGIPHFLNQQPALGSSPCHIVVEPSGRLVCIATYVGGSLAVYLIRADGSLGGISAHVQHQRAGKTAHAHSLTPAPAGCFALACDLGLDRIFVYRLDLLNGALTLHGETALAEGSGPRHLDFHPNGSWVYVINELNATVNVFAWDGVLGKLEPLQTISALSRDFAGPGWCADIHVHPNGRFVYGSNRGDHSLVIYRVDDVSGELSLGGFVPTRGRVPRNFALDPQGHWLLVANQDSDDVVVFRLAPESGSLTYHSHTEIPTPVCLKFAIA